MPTGRPMQADFAGTCLPEANIHAPFRQCIAQIAI